MESNTGKELTREELYEKVWSMPTTQLAAELGVSDVALANRCKRLNVPKPRAGYWTKIAAGKKPRKPPLPPSPGEAFVLAAEKPIKRTLPLPDTLDDLHPLAMELRRLLNREKTDSRKSVHVRDRNLPEVRITKALIDRAAMAFHTLLKNLEPLGITFRRAQGAYDGGYFQRSHDRFYVEIEEELVDERGMPKPWWNWGMEQATPSGLLTFTTKTSNYSSRDEKKWRETTKSNLERLLAEIATFARRHFVDAHKKRVQDAIESKWREIEWERRRREQEQAEAIRLEEERKAEAIRIAEERKENHKTALKTTAHCRSKDLLKAAEWWRLHQSAAQFIGECERRWRDSHANELTAAQQAWLAWARENAEAISPFDAGYPDPNRDGPFDPAAVPFGGPYPPTRGFRRPPTMLKIPAQKAEPSDEEQEEDE